MRRTIAGFHQDDDGDWVAELTCWHNQHVRHWPPFQDRPWVLDEVERASRIGAELDCLLCERADLPDGLRLVRTAGPFDAETLPSGLRQEHRVAEGTWGRLRVHEGSVWFAMAVDPPLEIRVETGGRQPIPPGVAHVLTVDGPVLLTVEFLVRAESVGDAVQHDGQPEDEQRS
jgi:tellurite resistance-related uncharacterized protein